jgi:hypothetical protein
VLKHITSITLAFCVLQFSACKNVVEISVPPPSVPTSLVIGTGTPTTVDLSWAASSGTGVITYNVFRSTTTGSGYTKIASNLSTTSYTDSTVVTAITYYYQVSASNANETSASSGEVNTIDYQSAQIIQKLQGTYTACIVSPTYSGYYNKVSVTVTNKVYDYIFELSSSATCATKWNRHTIKYQIDNVAYAIPGDVENFNIDFKIVNSKIQFNDNWYIGQNYCGLAWVIHTDKDVTGLACANLLSQYDPFHTSYKGLDEFEHQKVKLSTTNNFSLPFGYVQSGDSEAARKLLVVKTATIPKI